MARSVREELERLERRSVRLCKQESWLGKNTSKPNFRLLYSSVESYEAGSGFAILGINPAGDNVVADSDARRRGFREPGYSAYLDDTWVGSSKRGQDSLQREVQALAMILCGAKVDEALDAKNDLGAEPEERVGREAAALLRSTPSGNIIPFRCSKLAEVPIRLRVKGPQIGWDSLCLARPELRVIVTLANTVNDFPWRTLLKKGGQRPGSYYEKPVHKKLRRTYREVELDRGPLEGVLVIGLPAVVYHRGNVPDLSKNMFKELAKRVREHGLTAR